MPAIKYRIQLENYPWDDVPAGQKRVVTIIGNPGAKSITIAGYMALGWPARS
jgi:hypothetical protein